MARIYVACSALIYFLLVGEATALHLAAYFSSNGIHGKVALYQDPELAVKPVHLSVDLINRNAFEGNQTWTWFVATFPVDYSLLEGRCSSENIGGLVSDLGDLFGPITFVSNESVYFEFESTTEDFALTGAKGVWGRPLVLLGPSKEKVCSTIMVADEKEEWVAEARFRDGLAGSVFFRWVGSTKINVHDNVIFSNLMHTGNATASKNPWKIFVTDILDSKADQARANCDFLQILFNPGDATPAVGDLGSRLGGLSVGSIFTKSEPRLSFFRDTGLSLLPADLIGSHRSLYLVIFDEKHKDSFMACAKIRPHRPVVLKGVIQSAGVIGTIAMQQRTQYYPTRVIFNLTDLKNGERYEVGCKVHELLPHPDHFLDRCMTTKAVYNPLKTKMEANGSFDRYAVGDLDRKYGDLDFIGKVIEMWDIYLPLYGAYSVAHRSIVLHRDADGKGPTPWICATLHRYNSLTSSFAVPMITAKALYRYPIVGTVVFRQPVDQPWVDTTVIVEKLVHADGTNTNNSFNHRWSINEFPPGKDFYNWSKRCVSAGDIFNPFQVAYDVKQNADYCSQTNSITCRLGDLTNRIGEIAIAGMQRTADMISRHLFTDSSLPLSGIGSVLGKSLVIYDDFGPKARGDRLACSKIIREYHRKGVVKNWFDNGQKASVTGKIEFTQQSRYDIANLDVTLGGLSEARFYNVHMVPIQEELQFPCEDSTLYGLYNPIGIVPQRSPPIGTPDQYETGDLSGKFGGLDNKTNAYNDSTITLYGTNSILGRSIVIHKALKNGRLGYSIVRRFNRKIRVEVLLIKRMHCLFYGQSQRHNSSLRLPKTLDSLRWACANIDRGYAPSEARELRAIASFHHPLGFAYGYIRMTQLVYNDASTSDTILEVNLRYPGKNDRNYTRNHNWAIYVNPVSVDATVKIFNTRCTAGGYIWNPYYTQLADPLNEELYRAECGPDNSLRCYVGDVSGRLGTIDIGGKRQVFSDNSFPLEGDSPVTSAMGRSIVIFTPNQGSEKMACANIVPDKDIIKYANVRVTPGFVPDLFLEEFREIMGVPEWFLSIDMRQTKYLYQGNCIQFLLHFKGPDAGRLEQDFSRLLSTGNLQQPSIYIVGYVHSTRKTITSYRSCGTEDPLEAAKSKRRKNYSYANSAIGTIPNRNLYLILLMFCRIYTVLF